MATYSIEMTFARGENKDVIVTGVEAAYEAFEAACTLATTSDGITKVELWAAEDEDGSKWEQLEEEEF